MAHVVDFLKIIERACGVDVRRSPMGRIDRLLSRPWSHPKTAVFFVRGLERKPGSDERVRISRDVVSVLMPPLPAFARRVEEEHGLERKHIRSDQRFEHIEHARMEQTPFADRIHSVKLMDARESVEKLFERRTLLCRIESLDL